MNLLIYAVLATVLGPEPGAVLTLDVAIQTALSNSPAIKIAQSNVRKSEAQVDQAKAGTLPQGGLQGTYTRYDSKQPFSGRSDSKTVGAQLTWNLDLSGSISTAVRAASFAVRAQQAGVDSAANTLRADVRTAYYSVLRAQWVVKTNSEAVENSQRRLDIGRQKFAVGSVAQFDVVRLETALTQAQSDLVTAENGLKTAKQLLNNLLFRPIETDYEVAEIEPGAKPVPERDATVRIALNNRPELIALQYRKVSLENIRRIRERGLAPNLTVGVSAQHVVDAGAFQRKNTVSGSLTLNWPVLDGGLTRARVKEAKEDEAQVELALQQTTLGVSLEVQVALNQLITAQEQQRLAQQQTKEAAEALRIANVLFESGRGILLDVTTAQEVSTRASLALYNANYNVLTAWSALQKATGRDDFSTANAPKQQGNKE